MLVTLLFILAVAFGGSFGQIEEVFLSDYPRTAAEADDNGRIQRWLDDEPQAIHRWAGKLRIASPGIYEHRPRHIEGTCGDQGNALTGTMLIPVGEWEPGQAMLTLRSATVIRCLIIQVAVEGGAAENDPDKGLWIQKAHNTEIEDLTVQGLREGMDAESNATGRRFRGARFAGVFADFLMAGDLDVKVRNIEGTGVVLSGPNGVRLEADVSVGHGHGVEVWGNHPHPESIWGPITASGANLELDIKGEALDGWTLWCRSASHGRVVRAYSERTEGGLWLDACPWWSLRTARGGKRPLRVTGKSWGVNIEWLAGNGSWTYPDGRIVYAPVEIGWWTQDGNRKRVPKSWLLGLDKRAWYASWTAWGIHPAVERIDYPPAPPS